MSTNLYEILGVQADATPEQIRKAYKKRALQTHPDRVPASDKTEAEERFRQINNAYEVLIDPNKRQSYDRHGAWPPPPTEEPPRHTQHNTRSHPFPSNIFTFTDPFEIFDSFFGRARPLHDPFLFGPPRSFPDPFPPPPPFPFLPASFGPPGPFNSNARMGGGPFHDPFMMHPPLMGGDPFQPQSTGSGGRSASHFSSTSSFSNHHGAGGGQWVSESRSSSTINGLTTSVHECVDSSGNKHTTTTHPDGRRTYTVNGAFQTLGHIDAPLPPPPLVPLLNPTEPPRYHHHHHPRRRDHPRGRHNRPGTHRIYDRDYSPHHRDLHHPYT